MVYKAFVSSTFEDLKEHRAAVIAALRDAGIHVDPMENWTAATAEPKMFSQDRLKDCDLCVLLVAFRRGHVPEGETQSITQLEYEAARKEGLDILVYMLGEDERWYRKFDELDKDPVLKTWRAELMERHGVKFFGSDAASIRIEPALVRQFLERPGHRSGDARPPSNIPTRGRRPFVGRDKDISDIPTRLDADPPPRAVVLTGPPGVGKSELAREYARLSASRYTGGTFVVNCDADGPPADLARIGSAILGLRLSDMSLEDQCLTMLHALGSKPTLLILDNVRAAESVENWLPVSGQSCHAVVTSTHSDWGAAFDAFEVKPLDFEQSKKLAQTIGPRIPDRFAAALAEASGGLPQQICSQAAALEKDVARGRLNSAALPMPLAPELVTSYRRAYDQLEPPARLLLHAATIFRPHKVPGKDLCQTVIAVVGGDLSSATRCLDACRDLYLLTGQDELNMHELLRGFVSSVELDQPLAEQLAEVRKLQWQHFVGLASKSLGDPANAISVQSLSAFRSDLAAWNVAALEPTIGQLLRIGDTLAETGQFAAARPWFERAAEAAEKGDERGHIDYTILGGCLHQVGYCLSSLGQFAAARLWNERAVEAKEKGEVLGRIDHDSLGSSLHQVGVCLSSLGEFAAARPWYERAVEARKKGDADGRVDHEGLGRSLSQVGYCLSRLGEFAAARPWFERGVEVTEKGDVLGRIDHDSLGRNLHQVGYCLSSLGDFATARRWHERAVEAMEKGDVHGRIDHEGLGRSLHQTGYCLSRLGEFAKAKQWFERAAEAAEKGDVHGRIDHDSLGSSLHQVGFCLSSLGEFAEAEPWLERAIEAADKGDMYGRVDHDSLATSLYQAGYCLSMLGKFAAAKSLFERAVDAAEKGDVYGRVNYENLIAMIRSVAASFREIGASQRADQLEARARQLDDR